MNIEGAVQRIREDGYAVVPDFLDDETTERLRVGLAPVFDAVGSRVMDDSSGQQTIHTHNLLAKTRAVDEILVDDRLLDLVGAVLGRGSPRAGRRGRPRGPCRRAGSRPGPRAGGGGARRWAPVPP